MAKLVGYELSWTASASADVAGYKIYWTPTGAQPDYLSPNFNVGNVSKINVNAIPDFPMFEGNVILGLTAVDTMGNESDMVTKTFTMDRTAPQPPTDFTMNVV